MLLRLVPAPGSRRTSILVGAHLRARGHPRPRPVPRLSLEARALGIVARQALVADQWTDWLEVAPDFVHCAHIASRLALGVSQRRVQQHAQHHARHHVTQHGLHHAQQQVPHWHMRSSSNRNAAVSCSDSRRCSRGPFG